MTGIHASGRRTRISGRVALVVTAGALLAALVGPARALPGVGDTPRPVATALVALNGMVYHTGAREFVDVAATLKVVTAAVFRPARSVVVLAVAVQKATAFGESGRRYQLRGAGLAQRVVSHSAPVNVVMTFTARLSPTEPFRPGDPIIPPNPVMPVKVLLDLFVGTGGISGATAIFHPTEPT